MSDQLLGRLANTVFNRPGSADSSGRPRWVLRILPLILFLAVLAAISIRYWNILFDGTLNGYIGATFLAILLSILLSLLPAMICVVQNTTRRRQLNRLAGLRGFPVGQSTYYRVALTAVNLERTGAVDQDFNVPLFAYFLVVLIGFAACFLGYRLDAVFMFPSFILGGLKDQHAADFAKYQSETFAVMGTAFVAAYVYSLGRLLDRVNNNDIYPICPYYYAVRAVIACVAAGVMRHTAELLRVESSCLLLLIAFGIGFAPDLFVVAVSRRAFQALKIWGSRGDPPRATRPSSLPLLMIDDLSRDKIDRLSELGIDSAQVLARQNPFLMLPRLPYDLGLLVDWIGQAQLYVLVKDAKLQALRMICVRDVFDLHIRLQCEAARPGVCKALEISEGDAAALKQQLDEDASFTRLREVRDGLLEEQP